MYGAIDLAATLEASPAPTDLLDAMVLFWAERDRPFAPTGTLEDAVALVEDVAPGTLWTLVMRIGKLTVTITAIHGQVACVSAEGATPALALVAALVKAAGRE